ncbi:MAG: ABC transporter substrate-binding protein [Ruminococcus sp.]|nr:ABC transporter substrate-binding protein [Ruminococcus sp.]
MNRLKYIAAAVIMFSTAVSCSFHNEEHDCLLTDMNKTGSMKLEYAEMFTVDFYENDLSLVTIGENDYYLIIPEKSEIPENIPDNTVVLTQPAENIYLAASSAMDLFEGINALDSVKATSTAFNDWSLPAVKEAMEKEKILYAGKYSSPDYELIIDENCSLAIESTMIYHSPEIKEQLENLGIPVMVEKSSYESHPLGRMEWIKLYGLLTGKTKEAEDFFNEKVRQTKDILADEKTGKTTAFFYITSDGKVNIHKPGDYVSKMIELAGGELIFNAEELNVEDNSLSTMNMQFEAFYAKAKDADFLIYNSAIDGELFSIDQLIQKNSLFSDFTAVQNGNVWCTDKNIFQQTADAADMIADMHKIFTGLDDDKTMFIKKLN